MLLLLPSYGDPDRGASGDASAFLYERVVLCPRDALGSGRATSRRFSAGGADNVGPGFARH